MGLTEITSELFRMKNVMEFYLISNKLCSLPSEIALMTTLEKLYVRLSKRLREQSALRAVGNDLGLDDRDLTERHVVSGRAQPAHVSSARTRSAGQSQAAHGATLETVDHA
jgi:hypothetical protein